MPAALITGAGSGIGRATARELDRRGYRVVATDLDGAAARATAGELTDALALALDVTDAEAVAAATEDALAWAGALDVLVNSAGVGSTDTVLGTSDATWAAVMTVNVTGTFHTCRAVLPGMIERRGGAIVNVASVAGLVGFRDRAAYCASKGAVVSLTRAMALDHVADGVRVNCVCPGTVDSPWVERLLAGADDPGAASAALAARQPMGRLGAPDEIAASIAYLAGPDGSFITGSALVIDGGLTAG